jgi:hypothetical protein
VPQLTGNLLINLHGPFFATKNVGPDLDTQLVDGTPKQAWLSDVQHEQLLVRRLRLINGLCSVQDCGRFFTNFPKTQ